MTKVIYSSDTSIHTETAVPAKVTAIANWPTRVRVFLPKNLKKIELLKADNMLTVPKMRVPILALCSHSASVPVAVSSKMFVEKRTIALIPVNCWIILKLHPTKSAYLNFGSNKSVHFCPRLDADVSAEWSVSGSPSSPSFSFMTASLSLKIALLHLFTMCCRPLTS